MVWSLNSTVWFKWLACTLLRRAVTSGSKGQPKKEAVFSYLFFFLQNIQYKVLMFNKKGRNSQYASHLALKQVNLNPLKCSREGIWKPYLLWKPNMVLLLCPTALMSGYLKEQPHTGSLQPDYAPCGPPSEERHLVCHLVSPVSKISPVNTTKIRFPSMPLVFLQSNKLALFSTPHTNIQISITDAYKQCWDFNFLRAFSLFHVTHHSVTWLLKIFTLLLPSSTIWIRQCKSKTSCCYFQISSLHFPSLF